jgi:hypothetical protein
MIISFLTLNVASNFRTTSTTFVSITHWAIALFIRTPLLRLSGISNSPPPQRPPKVDQKWKNFYGRVHNEKGIPKDRIKISKEIYTR